MSYKYCVVWFRRAKWYCSKDEKGKMLPRPIEVNAKLFRSLKQAKAFQKERLEFWFGSVPIYKLVSLLEHSDEGEEK